MNLKYNIEDITNSWIIRQKDGLSKFEEKEFKIWLQDKKNRQNYEENKKLLDECLDLDENFIKELEDEINEDVKPKLFLYNAKYLVASISILCIIAFSGYEMNRYFIPNFTQNFASVDEKILNITLPDNSIIDLDKNSKIEISYYGAKRVIKLKDGNAMFDVAKEKDKPFLIRTKDILIEVLGTKFEVINYDEKTIVNVLEGVVQVSYISNFFKTKTLVKLEKSQSITLNNEDKNYIQNSISSDEIASWKKDMIAFNKTNLKDASIMFQRYSNNKMIFEDKKLSELKISGKFSTLNYDNFLKSIEMIYPIKIVKDGNIVKVGRKLN